MEKTKEKVSRETTKIDLYKIWLNYGKLKIEKSGNTLSRLINATLEDIEKSQFGLLVLREEKNKSVEYYMINGSIKSVEKKYILREQKVLLAADVELNELKTQMKKIELMGGEI